MQATTQPALPENLTPAQKASIQSTLTIDSRLNKIGSRIINVLLSGFFLLASTTATGMYYLNKNIAESSKTNAAQQQTIIFILREIDAIKERDDQQDKELKRMMDLFLKQNGIVSHQPPHLSKFPCLNGFNRLWCML